MPRLVKQRSKKSGLPPGSLVHIGEVRAGEPRLSVISYDETGIKELHPKDAGECLVFKDGPAVTWIDIEGIHDIEMVRKLGECYGFHPLVLEDILNTDQRPKMEDYGEYLYIVLRMLHKAGDTRVVTEQISILLGRNFVISFQEGIEGDAFNSVRERLRSGKGRIRGLGADYLAYSMTDAIVDNYFLALEQIGEKVETLEDELVANPSSKTLHKIHELKRETLFLRKAVWPLREVISNLERGESPLIHDATRIYLRDVYDHTIQVIDTIETSRDMLSGMLDIYLSSISNRMNEIMKFLTVIGTIFIPLTFVVGVYGMNFRYMPELQWRWGYFAVLGITAVIGVVMILYFRKKKWL
ncbi:MAG: magnesium/cobalt transporter CorA [Nitrospirae bacterium]|nr:magnesium/cobalt transporter CorA [Nitrospirota bacterium]